MGFSLRCAIAFLSCYYIVVLPAFAQERYFPVRAFSDNLEEDRYLANWYGSHLKGLNEGSLYEQAKSSSQSYRFLWLRSFHNPIAARLDVRSDGIGILTIKVASGTGSAAAGHVIERRARRLTKQQTDSFLNQVNSLAFWKLPARAAQKDTGPDGAQWVFEGLKDGEYHIVSQWSPQSGTIRTLALALVIDMGHLEIPAKDIY
jgi:hypothetical protein